MRYRIIDVEDPAHDINYFIVEEQSASWFDRICGIKNTVKTFYYDPSLSEDPKFDSTFSITTRRTALKKAAQYVQTHQFESVEPKRTIIYDSKYMNVFPN